MMFCYLKNLASQVETALPEIANTWYYPITANTQLTWEAHFSYTSQSFSSFNSHTPSQYFPSPKASRAMYQATRDHPYSLKPTKIIQN